MKKAGLTVLAAAVFAFALPPQTWADGERATTSEASEYAAREARTPGLEQFRGGCGGPDGPMLVLLIVTLPISLPLFGLYKLGEWAVEGIGLIFHPKPAPETPKPQPTAPPGNVGAKLHPVPSMP